MSISFDNTGKDPMNGQSLLDPMGKNSPLPLDVMPIIFQNLKSELPDLALVCKNWKNFVDDKKFRQMIRPPEAFGSQEWKEYIGVDAGEEPSMPRWGYGRMEEGKCMLTFMPKVVKVNNEDGTVKEVPLDSLAAIGQLTTHPKKGNGCGYSGSDIAHVKDMLEEKRKLEEPHWVWISKEAIGRSKTYAEQQALAKKNKVQISDLVDTVVSVLAEYIRFGERNFTFDQSFDLPCPDNDQYTLLRVNDKEKGDHRMTVGFHPTGLIFGDLRDKDGHVVFPFAPSRKSF